MLDDGLAGRPRNTDNIESRVALMKSFFMQKKLSRPNHLLLFSHFHGVERRTEPIIGTGFNFDEYNDTTVQHDQIDFSG